MNGGALIADALQAHGVRFVFTLCGGHISPILVGAHVRGIRVVDVRHEATAVFAADAVARLTGGPGVAVVTAGPGVTNTITAVKNAQLAQSPVLLLGGAAATVLKGRGALQDIDQLSLIKSAVKWSVGARRVRELVPAIHRAVRHAQDGVPGPVFVECPVDLLYDEPLVREWYGIAKPRAREAGLASRARHWILRRKVDRLFDGPLRQAVGSTAPQARDPEPRRVRRAARYLARAERPVLVVGSQATLQPQETAQLADAITALGVPVYLVGTARGLLGRRHPLQFRHRRRQALGEADLVILAGTPCDFRLNYGRHINRRAVLVAVNRSRDDLRKNRRPTVSLPGGPSVRVVRALSAVSGDAGRWTSWIERLRARDQERTLEILDLAGRKTEFVNPVALCRTIDEVIDDDSVLVADGGDFVATASYVVAPRGPLSWLDAGVFGTLGAGAGFALAAKLCRPAAQVWVLYGDGSAGFSLAEFDTMVRHRLPVVAVVGNDGAWTQIARGQVAMLGDDVATTLRRTDYHRVAEGYGGAGFLVERPEELVDALSAAKAAARSGRPALVNVLIGQTEFRAGSLSM